MPDPAVRISEIAQRAIVRLKAYSLAPPPTPPQGGGEDSFIFSREGDTDRALAHDLRGAVRTYGKGQEETVQPPSNGEKNITPSLWEGAGGGSSLVSPDFGSEVQLLALAPGEWWLTSDTQSGAQLGERLRQHLEGQDTAAVDLSCALKVIRIEGSATRALLAKGCGLDLDPRQFPGGFATRTRFAQLPVLVHCVGPASCFDLYVGRSYCTWLLQWLADAASPTNQ